MAHSTVRKNLPAIAIFARAPEPGKAKTRLAPLLGPEGAAAFQAALIADALRKVELMRGLARYCFFSSSGGFALAACRKAGARRNSFTLMPQEGANLGKRLERAFRQLVRHHPRAVVMGTDSPALSPRVLRQALQELRWCDAVLGPCPDGGYYLIGLRKASKDLLRGVRWGTGFAFGDTLRSLLRHGFSCSVLEPLPDVDRPPDWRRLWESLSSNPQLRRLAPATWSCVNEAQWAQNTITASPRARRSSPNTYQADCCE